MRFKNMGTKSILAHMNLFIIKHHPYTVIFGNPAKQMILMLQMEQHTLGLTWSEINVNQSPSQVKKQNKNKKKTQSTTAHRYCLRNDTMKGNCLLMSINVCTYSCQKYKRKSMQTIREHYANSLQNEKKKPIGNCA